MEFIETKTEGYLKFVLPDVLKKQAKGREVSLNKRYVFDKNGELKVPAKDAAKMQRILCRYYSCKLVAIENDEPVASVEVEEIKAGGKVESKTSVSGKPTSNQPSPAQK